MLARTQRVAVAVVVLVSATAFAAKDPDERFWAAVRKNNTEKVAGFLERGVTPESRMVALSISVTGHQTEAFNLLWNYDNSDIAADAMDFVLCYAHRNPSPSTAIQDVLEDRSLTIDACCERERQQEYCARRPVKLTDRRFPATQCRMVFTEEEQVPPGATRVAVLWDERVAVLDQATSARYGLPELSKIAVKDWAMEFASILGALGADAMLITKADRDVASNSSTTRFPTRNVGSLVEFTFGTITDRIEIVAIRTRALE